MKYEKICRGKFISRPNRFIAEVETGGYVRRAHVRNTGRWRELLVTGADLIMEDFRDRMGKRKLEYSLIGVTKETARGPILINVDSQAPNKVVGEALRSGKLRIGDMKKAEIVKSEYTYGTSRLDFYVKDETGREALVEVKGVTLEEDGTAMFPDAPTERGVKHIRELMGAASSGYVACVIFVIQMKGIDFFRPNDRTHAEFGEVLREAQKAGVEVLAYDCIVGEDSLRLDAPVEIKL